MSSPRKHGVFGPRKGFTLVELLVVVAIIGLLAALAVPAIAKVRNRAGAVRELAALRGVVMGWTQYAASQKGWLIPCFYGLPPLEPLPAFYEDGRAIPSTVYGNERSVVARWPWRLAPYLDHDARPLQPGNETWQVNDCSAGDPMKALYFGSLYPGFGMNGMWVGGDQERYGFMPSEIGGRPNPFHGLHVSRLSGIRHPERLTVFASARTNQDACATGQIREGYFRLESPQWLGPQWQARYDPTLASSCGNVSARWDGQAAVATANGGVELVAIEELRDMRRWADQADKPDWRFSPR